MTRLISAGLLTVAVASAAIFGYVTGASAQQTYKETHKIPEMVTGENIGFMPSQEGSRVGKLMIRVDGKWVEAQLSAGPRMVPAK
jgi:hypothetical protein